MPKSTQKFAGAFDDVADDYDDHYDDDSEDAVLYRRSVSAVVDHASPRPHDMVLDLGTGTGAVALALAEKADVVVGRDISDGMLDRAAEKAAERGIDTATFGRGRFRDPNVETADIVVSNWAIHHLPPVEQCEAIETIAGLSPRRVVLGAAMHFVDRDPEEPIYDPDSVYPTTVGRLVEVLTDVGFVLTDAIQLHDQCGVLVARAPESD